jgi:hypothetical protein
MNQNTVFTTYRSVFAPPGHPDLDRIATLAKEAPSGDIEVHAFGEKTILRRERSKDEGSDR